MKTQFTFNILLTIIWVMITGDMSFANITFAFLMAYGILWIVSRGGGRSQRRYFVIIPRIIRLFFFFLKELVKANLQVAYEVMTPKYNMTPGMVAVPIDVKTDFEISLLAYLISLTPGTISIDVSTNRKVLYIHAMYIPDKEEFIKEIKEGFEKRILEISE
ncbi:MAG: Na+/H+ antiporter subunit E [Capnocytophaga sp.]|nr:Na+/H+ antiporter subunit E [Capnocytophaga sp.]